VEQEGDPEPERTLHLRRAEQRDQPQGSAESPLNPAAQQLSPAPSTTLPAQRPPAQNPLFEHQLPSPLSLTFGGGADSPLGTPRQSSGVSTPHSVVVHHWPSAASTPTHAAAPVGNSFHHWQPAQPLLFTMQQLAAPVGVVPYYGNAPLQYKGTNAADALDFSDKMTSILLHVEQQSKGQAGTSVMHAVLSAAASFFPAATPAARWFADVTGLGSTALDLRHGDDERPNCVMIAFLAELGLGALHSLTPTTNPAAATQAQAFLFTIIQQLNLSDLQHPPVNLLRLLHDSHLAYLSTPQGARARGTYEDERDEAGRKVRMTAEDAAMSRDYSPAYFKSSLRHQPMFHPSVDNLAADRQVYLAFIDAARQAIPSEWHQTSQYLSQAQRDRRLASQRVPTCTKFIVDMFRAQFAKATGEEQALLRNCSRLQDESYEHFQARFQTAVGINRHEPPFSRNELGRHFMAQIEKGWGADAYKHLRTIWSGLDEDTRTVAALYQPARAYLQDDMHQLDHLRNLAITPAAPSFARSHTLAPPTAASVYRQPSYPSSSHHYYTYSQQQKHAE